MMTTRIGAQGAGLGDFLGGLVNQSSLRLAIAGDGDGGLMVPGRPNFIYVRVGGVGGDVAQVRISAVRPAIGDSIFIQRENPMRAAGWRLVFWLRAASDATLPPPLAGL